MDSLLGYDMRSYQLTDLVRESQSAKICLALSIMRSLADALAVVDHILGSRFREELTNIVK